MAKLLVLSGRDIVKALAKVGFKAVRQKGSHIVLRKGNKGLVVPDHKEVDRGTLVQIIRQAELTRAEFIDLLE